MHPVRYLESSAFEPFVSNSHTEDLRHLIYNRNRPKGPTPPRQQSYCLLETPSHSYCRYIRSRYDTYDGLGITLWPHRSFSRPDPVAKKPLPSYLAQSHHTTTSGRLTKTLGKHRDPTLPRRTPDRPVRYQPLHSNQNALDRK